MGGNPSKSDADPSISFLSEPWRKIHWGEKQTELQYVEDYEPQVEGQKLRILLHGPVGAGKSSFINSVQSVLCGRMWAQALADHTSHDCFTKKFTTYSIQKNHTSDYRFVFNDIMGLNSGKGVLVKDVKRALMGQVKEGYKFNPESPLSKDNSLFNHRPTANDVVHVLVCVVPASTVSLMDAEIVQKIRDIRIEASQIGIPQVAVLTKIDEVCPEIKQNLQNVYKIENVKEKTGPVFVRCHVVLYDDGDQMEKFSTDVGIPMNCIFPVKNYHEEINLDDDTDMLILSALRNIINSGDDFINLRNRRV